MPVIKHNHGWDNSYPAFKPSIYSTGVQSTQPYTPEWPEGAMYGATDGGEDSVLWELTPHWMRSWMSGGTYDEKGGTITAPDGSKHAASDVAEAFGIDWKHDTTYPEQIVRAADVATGGSPECDAACEARKRRKAIIGVAVGTGVAFVAFVALRRKMKYGKVL